MSTDSDPAAAPAAAFDGTWEREGRHPSGAALFGLFGIGALYFYGQTIFFLIFAGTTSLFGPSFPGQGNASPFRSDFFAHYIGSIRLTLLFSQYLCMLLPTLWLVRRWHTRERWKYLRYRPASARVLLLAVIGTIALFPISNAIGDFFQRLFPLPRIFEELTEGVFRANSPWEFLWLVLLVAVTPAICEETLFRGFAQRTLGRVIGWKSVVVVGIIFGLFHMQPLGLVSLSLIGLFIGYVFYRSGSIYPSMAGHFTNNFLAILIVYTRPRIGGIDLATTGTLPAGWLLFSVALFLLALVGLRIATRPPDEERWRPPVAPADGVGNGADPAEPEGAPPAV